MPPSTQKRPSRTMWKKDVNKRPGRLICKYKTAGKTSRRICTHVNRSNWIDVVFGRITKRNGSVVSTTVIWHTSNISARRRTCQLRCPEQSYQKYYRFLTGKDFNIVRSIRVRNQHYFSSYTSVLQCKKGALPGTSTYLPCLRVTSQDTV